MIKTFISESIKEAVKSAYNIELEIEPTITESSEEKFGDYSTQISFQLSKLLRKKPNSIAEYLKDILKSNNYFDRVDVVGGYINFFVNINSYHQAIGKVIEAGENYSKKRYIGNEKILIEFVSSNPTGPMVIVNARAAAIGDSLIRILNWRGFRAFSEFYVNDSGNQVKLLGLSCNAIYKQLNGKNAEIPKNGYHGKYLVDFVESVSENNPDLENMNDDEIDKFLGEKSVKYFHDLQIECLKNFRVNFDYIIHEKSIREENLPEFIVKRLRENNLLYTKENAIFFKSTAFGDDKDRPIIKSNGEYAYILPDAAYHEDKMRRGFDYLIDIFGPDHHGYKKRLKAIFHAIGYNPDHLEIILHQMVNLTNEGNKIRMSKRKGYIVSLDDLIDDIGKDAARFFFVLRKVNSHLDFDLELAKQKTEENPVYYVQYAHARISSIIRFAEEKGIDLAEKPDISTLGKEKELMLIKKIIQFPEILDDVISHREPSILPRYLIELSSKFHSFYNDIRVVTDDKELTRARITLIKTVKSTLKIGLDLIGVDAPEKM
jgi:arginyl-tRNA synthetase